MKKNIDWTRLDTAEMKFARAKKEKRRQIWGEGDAVLAEVKQNYTVAEIESWSKQEQGAKNIQAGNAPTEAAQFVAAIAQTRGMATAVLVEKILANVANYGALSAAVIGRQQMLDTSITVATTQAELDAITWEAAR